MARITAKHRTVHVGDIFGFKPHDHVYAVRVLSIANGIATVKHVSGAYNSFDIPVSDLHPFDRADA